MDFWILFHAHVFWSQQYQGMCCGFNIIGSFYYSLIQLNSEIKSSSLTFLGVFYKLSGSKENSTSLLKKNHNLQIMKNHYSVKYVYDEDISGVKKYNKTDRWLSYYFAANKSGQKDSGVGATCC